MESFLVGNVDSFAICPGVCNSHGDFPLASSMDRKSYFLAREKSPCKATPPLLRL